MTAVDAIGRGFAFTGGSIDTGTCGGAGELFKGIAAQGSLPNAFRCGGKAEQKLGGSRRRRCGVKGDGHAQGVEFKDQVGADGGAVGESLAGEGVGGRECAQPCLCPGEAGARHVAQNPVAREHHGAIVEPIVYGKGKSTNEKEIFRQRIAEGGERVSGVLQQGLGEEEVATGRPGE